MGRRLHVAAGTNGVRIAWQVQRAKTPTLPPLLLINGWGGVSDDWGGLVRRLARERDVVTFDNRGVGRSDVPASPEEYTIPGMAGDAAAVMRAAWETRGDGGPMRYDVCGFSMGGLVAQELALSAETGPCVARLVLASTSPGGREAAQYTSTDFFQELDGFIRPDPTHTPLEREKQKRRAAAAFFVHGLPRGWVSLNVEALKRAVERFLDEDVAPRPAAGLAGQRRAFADFNASERLGELECKTLVLHGDIDPVIDPFCAMLLAKLIPRASLVLLAGVGHHTYIQEPLEWAEAIQRFLSAEARS